MRIHSNCVVKLPQGLSVRLEAPRQGEDIEAGQRNGRKRRGVVPAIRWTAQVIGDETCTLIFFYFVRIVDRLSEKQIVEALDALLNNLSFE